MAHAKKTSKTSKTPIRIFTPPAESLPVAPSTASAIELSGEDAQQLRTLLLLMQHHQSLMQQIDAQAQTLVSEHYGVNVAQGGGWSLNLAAGLLEPVKEPASEPGMQPGMQP